MKRSRAILFLLLSLTLIFSFCSNAQAVSTTLYMHSRLVTPEGTAFPNGTYTGVFKIYNVETAGAPTWTETQTVTVTSGMMSVLLGKVTAFPGSLLYPETPKKDILASVFVPESKWVEISLTPSGGGTTTVFPRKKITTSAYAANADFLDGLHANSFARTAHTHAYAPVSHTHPFSDVTTGAITGDIVGQILTITNTHSGSGRAITASGFWEGIKATATGGSGYGVFGVGDNTEAYNVGGYFTANGNGASRGVYGSASNTGDYQNYGGYFEASGTLGRGVYAKTNGASGVGVVGVHGPTGNYAELGRSNDGVHVVAFSSGANGINSQSTTGDGVDSRTGGAGKSAYYGLATGTDGWGAYLRSDNGHGLYVYSPKKDGVRSFSGPGVTGETYYSAYYGVAEGATGFGAYLVASGTSGTGIWAQGGPSGWAATFNGKVRIQERGTNTTVLELGKGLDYAEGFDVTSRSTIAPGAVLVIDPQHPGKLSVSTVAYDSKVAGIAAGANDLGSGVRLGAGQFDIDVALAGRVYCNVDATRYEIKPGDLLTTSATPGHAMKAVKPGQGAILGKAMQGLKKGQKGQILVLVTLQ